MARGVTCGKGGRLARRPAASAPRARRAARRLGRPRRAVEVWADSVRGNARRGTSAFLHTFVSGRYHRGAAPQRRFRCGPASLRSPPPRRRSAHRIPRRRAAERGAAVKRLSRCLENRFQKWNSAIPGPRGVRVRRAAPRPPARRAGRENSESGSGRRNLMVARIRGSEGERDNREFHFFLGVWNSDLGTSYGDSSKIIFFAGRRNGAIRASVRR